MSACFLLKHLLVEVDLHKLPEAAAVVVPDGFCVPERLEQRIGCRARGGGAHEHMNNT